jgi:hypothetical protein
VDLARIVQGISLPNCNLHPSNYFLYVGYAVSGTRELLLLLPAAVHKEPPANPDKTKKLSKSSGNSKNRGKFLSQTLHEWKISRLDCL